MKADPRGVLTGTHFIDGDHACCEGALAAGARFAAWPKWYVRPCVTSTKSAIALSRGASCPFMCTLSRDYFRATRWPPFFIPGSRLRLNRR